MSHSNSTTTLVSSSQPTLRLVSPQQVQIEGLENFKILDASFHLPNSNRSILEEFKLNPRLPNSSLFDHDSIADTDYTIHHQAQNPIRLAHMLPNLSTFKRAMESLALTRDDHILLYDSVGIFSSPRAAWLLHSYGHPKISVLDGGLPRWIHEKGPVETGEPNHDPTHPTSSYSNYRFEDNLDHELIARQRVISYDDVLKNLESTDRLDLFDARPHGRFLGTDPEPRPGLSSGHIPASISLPFTKLLTSPKGSGNEAYRTYLRPEELEKVFLEALGHDRRRWERIKSGESGVIVSCGSGMTACIIWLAIHLCPGGSSIERVRLYDESWTGYAARKTSPIEFTPSPVPDPPHTITTTIA